MSPLFAAPAAGYGLVSGRTLPTLVAVIGLIGAIIGGLALARSRRSGATVALVVGPLVLVAAGIHLAAWPGGPGTGNGVVGSMIAVVMGLIGTVLGGLALLRSRRTT